MTTLELTDADRFQIFTASSLEELRDILNNQAHPYSRLAFIGQTANKDMTQLQWTAFLDLALPVVLTLYDVEVMTRQTPSNDPDSSLSDQFNSTLSA